MEEKTDKWVMLLCGLVGGWVICTAPGLTPGSSHEDWWHIATAVGTVGAVMTALVLSVAESRRRRNDARDRASLYAASVAAKLNPCLDVSRHAVAKIYFADEHSFDDRFVELMDSVDKSRRSHSITHEDIVPLIGLGAGTAHRIAQGLALLDILHRDMLATHTAAETRKLHIGNKATSKFAGKLSEAVDLLTVAQRHCEVAAKAYAKPPTGEELYGP